ncbi:methylmalonyl-CoA mutase subunit beta [Spongiimicrobium salis]|uniref:methylmalonyl-CoA mutase subunit beta n=1 Tax=Spongiimicrobium salis TaxID=1667022 RepID=UPI00374CE818
MSSSFLFEEFPKVSPKAWKQKIQVDLKGADYNDTLVWESPEGIKVKPFYTEEDRKATPLGPLVPENPWKIGQAIHAANATMANEKALDALSRGAESLVFTVPSETINSLQLLKGIDLTRVSVHLKLQFLSSAYVDQLLKAIDNPQALLYIHTDILGHLTGEGNWHTNAKEDHEALDKILALDTAVPLLGVDMARYQNAGATMVQQLAYALAHANEYLNHVEDASGIQPTFTVAVGTNYFFEIAKLRALRMLWKSLAAAYQNTHSCHILALPTKRNKTLYDYNVNMLRTTTECMAAVLGGADTVCNLPYDAIYHKDNAFGERMARNQLLILKEESYFDKVHNPADGAYYIESLTQQLAEKALGLFKDIEKQGGFLKQLKTHQIQKKIQESAQKELQNFEAGKEVLLGTNLYPNTEDRMNGALEIFPFVKTRPRKTWIPPIIEKRLAEKVEQERLEHE